MLPTDVLKREHRVIEQVLNCLEVMAQKCETSRQFERSAAKDMIEFFRNFADRCHHAKEEEKLFPLLEQRGFSKQEGPTAQMRSEHVQGRSLVQEMEASIEGASTGELLSILRFARCARLYINLLRAHIQKEDTCLFPMADETLKNSDQDVLTAQFEQTEHELGCGTHEKYIKLAIRLAKDFGVKNIIIQEDKG